MCLGFMNSLLRTSRKCVVDPGEKDEDHVNNWKSDQQMIEGVFHVLGWEDDHGENVAQQTDWSEQNLEHFVGRDLENFY